MLKWIKRHIPSNHPQILEGLQNEAKFYNTRSLINFPDDFVAKLAEDNIKYLKAYEPNVKILSSKIVTSPHNKSYFIMYDNPN